MFFLDFCPCYISVAGAKFGAHSQIDDHGYDCSLADTFVHHDYLMIFVVLDAYWATGMQLNEVWRNKKRWRGSSNPSAANVGWFSSDRTIAEYAQEIWNAPFRPLA